MSFHPRRAIALEVVGLVLLTLGFGAWTRLTDFHDWPLGDGWNRYIGNAIAVDKGDWGAYLPWRGPGHAWVSLVLLPVTGTLVRATQWMALGTTCLLFPLTWALGRALSGPRVAWFATLLLLAWPDLRLFAWFSGPYPLLGVWVGAGVLAATVTLCGAGWWRWMAAGAAGMAFAAAMLTDMRGFPVTAAVLAGATGALVPRKLPRPPREVVLRVLVMTLLGFGLAFAVFRVHPVEILSLSRQVALQRDHVVALSDACTTHGDRLPSLADFVDPCARDLLAFNVRHAAAAAPISPFLFAALAIFGGVHLARRELWRALILGLPVLTLAPSLFLISFQHRYLVPFAPLAAILVAAGVEGLVQAVYRRRPAFPADAAAFGLVLTLVFVWHEFGPSLETRGITDQTVRSANPEMRGVVVRASDRIRAEHAPGDRVVDCANGNLRERLYPIAVDPRHRKGNGERDCAVLLAQAPPHLWLLIRLPSTPLPSAWILVEGGTPAGAPALLRTP